MTSGRSGASPKAKNYETGIHGIPSVIGVNDEDSVAYLSQLGLANSREVLMNLKSYTGSDYEDFNYGGRPHGVKVIDEFIDVAPKGQYHIMRATSVDPALFKEKYAVGKYYDPKHLTSWTRDNETVSTFLGDQITDHPNNVLIVLHMTNKRGVNVQAFSSVPQETETLHKSTDKFKIKSVEWNDNGFYDINLSDG